ncbi:hypothetical protein ACHAXT_001121 [Thalassiosira profunda]
MRAASRSIGTSLAHLVAIASLAPTGVTGIEIETTDEHQNASNGAPPERSVEQYYFQHEIEFLARQAMTLGDHPDSDTDMDAARLRFIEKSLRMELNYIRRLKELRATANDSPNDATIPAQPKKTKRRRNALDVFIDAIRGATWTSLAYPAQTPIDLETIDHSYDFDRMKDSGIGGMYDDFDCYEQVTSQNKPLFTAEMWNKLKEEFATSALFPFPIPNETECPVEPFRADHTTDGKGRGCFATRRIEEGSLIHSGHPNTVFFLDNEAWYRFATSLPTMLACDVMEWAWQQDLTDSGNVVLCLNLDEAVFFNDGGWDGSVNMHMREPKKRPVDIASLLEAEQAPLVSPATKRQKVETPPLPPKKPSNVVDLCPSPAASLPASNDMSHDAASREEPGDGAREGTNDQNYDAAAEEAREEISIARVLTDMHDRNEREGTFAVANI